MRTTLSYSSESYLCGAYFFIVYVFCKSFFCFYSLFLGVIEFYSDLIGVEESYLYEFLSSFLKFFYSYLGKILCLFIDYSPFALFETYFPYYCLLLSSLLRLFSRHLLFSIIWLLSIKALLIFSCVLSPNLLLAFIFDNNSLPPSLLLLFILLFASLLATIDFEVLIDLDLLL